MLFGVLVLTQPAAFGQDAPEAGRKVKNQVTPSYPDLAKKLNVHGKVRMEVVIAPDGKVKSTRLIGGHPLLASAAQSALMQWKFEPGPKETTQIIEFNFD
jgi:protein TonB